MEPDEDAIDVMTISVKFQRDTFQFLLQSCSTVRDLKQLLYERTLVHPDRQKLIGLKNDFSDTSLVKELNIKKLKSNVYSLMMMGTPDTTRIIVPDDVLVDDVFDDFNLDYWPSEEEVLDYAERQELLKKVISQTQINLISPLDPQKKLLVLDLDHTLFDFGGRKKTNNIYETMRPGLIQFLTEQYNYYNIAIWSATAWTWLEIKLSEFGLLPNSGFRFSFALDKSAMVPVKAKVKGKLVKHNVKPLALIWSKFPQFNETNTIHVDDSSHNFVFNIKSGLQVSVFNYSLDSHNDRELYYLSIYLRKIAPVSNFTTLNHTKWRE